MTYLNKNKQTSMYVLCYKLNEGEKTFMQQLVNLFNTIHQIRKTLIKYIKPK